MDIDLLRQLVRRYERATFEVYHQMNLKLRERMSGEVTVDQFAIMRYLLRKGRSTSSELADSFSVGKSSITAMITRLTNKGYIVREPDTQDRRVTYLRLSSEGEQLCNTMENQVYEILVGYIKPFEKEEAVAFIETFEKLSNRMMEE